MYQYEIEQGSKKRAGEMKFRVADFLRTLAEYKEYLSFTVNFTYELIIAKKWILIFILHTRCEYKFREYNYKN